MCVCECGKLANQTYMAEEFALNHAEILQLHVGYAPLHVGNGDLRVAKGRGHRKRCREKSAEACCGRCLRWLQAFVTGLISALAELTGLTSHGYDR